MDEHVVLLSLDKVLKPCMDIATDNVGPFWCWIHMTSMIEIIQEFGVEVLHVPGKCTSLYQPVDIVIKKQLKKRIRDLWKSWMIMEGLVYGTTSPPL